MQANMPSGESPMITAKEAYRSARRAEILAAAERVIERVGVNGLTVRQVLEEAGVAQGTLYSYFAGKDELLEAMAERVMTQYLAGIAQEGATRDQMFLSILKSSFTYPPEGVELLVDLKNQVDNPEHASGVRQLNEGTVEATRPLLEELLDQAKTAVDDVDALAELLSIVWDGMTRRQRNGSFVTTYERVGAVVIDLLLAPLASEASQEEAVEPAAGRRTPRRRRR